MKGYRAKQQEENESRRTVWRLIYTGFFQLVVNLPSLRASLTDLEHLELDLTPPSHGSFTNTWRRRFLLEGESQPGLDLLSEPPHQWDLPHSMNNPFLFWVTGSINRRIPRNLSVYVPLCLASLGAPSPFARGSSSWCFVFRTGIWVLPRSRLKWLSLGFGTVLFILRRVRSISRSIQRFSILHHLLKTHLSGLEPHLPLSYVMSLINQGRGKT